MRSPFGKSTPDMRVVWAVKGTKMPPAAGRWKPNCFSASSTMERPFGRLVGERGQIGRLGEFPTLTPATGTNSDAMRLPKVMVPVLSSSSTSMSPAASTARPDLAITFAFTSRSMPAMPMAERSPPIVVGISVTNSATR